MKHVIMPESEGLTVQVSEIAEQQERLLTEFQACQEGRCSCPTAEYEKLESLEIVSSAGKVSLRLTAKAGQAFDRDEIERCLRHTARKLDQTA